MKSVRYEGKDARRFLGSMIMDPVVCARVAGIWNGGDLFSTNEENMVAGWCIDYMRKYGTSPGPAIRGMYEDWAVGRSEDSVKLVERLLTSLNDEWLNNQEHYRTDYALDLGSTLLTRVKVKKAIEEAQVDLEDRNDAYGAQGRLSALGPVNLDGDDTIKVTEDLDVWMEAIDDQDHMRPLVTYPGVLGRFIGNEFRRDALVVLIASSKRGKSFFIQDLAYRVVKARCNLAYFDAGDHTKYEVLMRLGQRVLRRPLKTKTVLYPVEFKDKRLPPVVEERRLEGISGVEAFRAWRKISRGKDLFRLSCYSAGSLAVAEIRSKLQGWGREGWHVDVLLVDYADILALPHGREDRRDKINRNWMDLRRLSQDFNCCVVTATQADAESYSGMQLRKRNFNNDRRVHDHVTAMLGLYSSEEEKEKDIIHVNLLDRRFAHSTERQEVLIAGCLDIACPVILSVK
jgi:hypothetical protein